MAIDKSIIKVVFTDGEILEISQTTGFCYTSDNNTWEIFKRAEYISINANYVKYIGRKSLIDNEV
jgi:hypothetical protein